MLPGSVRNPNGYTHVPSNENVRIESDRSSGQMTTNPINIDMEVDPQYILPGTTEVQTKKIDSLLNDVTKIQSRKRSKPAPTLATGRRNLKSEKVSDEEARKRCKRRDSNRLSAQRSREKRTNIANELEEEVLKLEKANSFLKSDLKIKEDTIAYIKDSLAHSCLYSDTTQSRIQQQQQVPVPILSQPMSASSCGSDCPVSNTSQGLTPPPLTEEIVIKHSPPDNFDQPGTISVRPTTLSIPTVNSISVSHCSNQSYLEQLRLPDQQGQVPTTYYSTSFCDNLSTPVLSYNGYNMEYGSTDISVIPSVIPDSDGMNLP